MTPRPSRHPDDPRRARAWTARFALVGLLLLGLPGGFGVDGGRAAISMGPAAARALTAEDLINKAREKQRVRELLAPYAPDVRRSIRDVYRALGKGPGAIELAIEQVVNQGGTGNSAVKRDAFAQTVYPIVRQNCADCHGGSGPGFPNIAHKTVTTAYDAIVSNQKVRLSDPVRSRLVQRLASDHHYCWSNCDADAAEMQAAIEQWAAMEDSLGGGVDVGLIQSNSSSMAEGKVDKKKGRVEDHVIAKWEFKEGSGNIAHDTSKVKPAMDLQVHDAEWMSNWGLEFKNRSWAMAPQETSVKLYKRIASPQNGTQQFSIEAWIAPANTDQDGPARIATYAGGTDLHNFALAQNLYTYVFRNRNRSRKTDKNGTPDLQTADDDEDAQAYLQHVVVTYDRINGRRVYVNGNFTGDKDPVKGQLLFNWDKSFRFAIGNETSLNRQWEGQMRYLAIHDVALSKKQIRQNYHLGVGQRFLVSFNLDEWLATTGNAIQFSVTEFDGYSYLFCDPSFIGPQPLDYSVAGIEIAVNGVRSATGQAFSNVETIVTTSGASVSRLCSIIPKDQGPDLDRFSIRFARLGDFQNVTTEDPPDVVVPEDDLSFHPVIGVRTFDQVNLSMAGITGVSPLAGNIPDTFDVIKTQLPVSPDPRSFLSSNQVAVAKLALEYCNEMVDSPTLRDQFFGASPPFEFDADATVAFSTPTKRNQIIDALYDRMILPGLREQPLRSEVAPVVDGLIQDLTAGCDAASCPAERTRTVVKAACAAVLSSAAVTIH